MGPYDLTRLTEGLLGQVGIQGQILTDARNTNLAQQQMGAQTALLNAQVSDAQRKAQMRQQFDADVAVYLKNPTPDAIQALASRYPEYAQELKQAWQLKDTAQVRADRTVLGSAYSALKNKRPDLALATLRRRRDAEKERGINTSALDEQIAALESGDQNAAKTVAGALLAQLSASDENFGASYENIGGEVQNDFTLAPGARRFRADGSLVAEAPFAPRPVTVSEGQTVVEYQPGGGGQASGGAGGGDIVARMVPITLQSESGNRDYAPDGSPLTSRSGAVGRMQVMPGTNADPGYGVRPAQDGSMEERARVGRDYLAAMVQRYGNPQQAWAAYNAGPGRVDQAIREGGQNWLSRLPQETQDYVRKNMALLQGGGGQLQGGPRVIAQGGQKQREAPSGYTWSSDGSRLVPIPGGPADPAVAGGRNPSASRKAEADFRKEFNGLPEVKLFNKARPQFEALRALATKPNPTAADDIALIFAYMKTLDPDSVVRETEYATAQNAGGIPESVRNAFNKAKDGTRLTPQQRAEFAQTAMQSYIALRNAYNQQAENYRGYARDNGVNPDRVARRYLTARQQQEELVRQGRAAPRAPIPVKSPQQAQAMRRDGRLKPGDRIVTPDGRVGTVR